MTDSLTKADRQAGCLASVMLVMGFIAIILAFFSGARESFLYNLSLGLGMALPLIFPLLAIVMIRRVSKLGAAFLLSAVIALLLMTAVVWVLLANNMVNDELGEGIAVELIGSVFTAISIVLIEATIKKFTDDDGLSDDASVSE